MKKGQLPQDGGSDNNFFARQSGNIVAQVGVNVFFYKSVTFVMNIEDVLSRKDHIQIAVIATRATLSPPGPHPPSAGLFGKICLPSPHGLEFVVAFCSTLS